MDRLASNFMWGILSTNVMEIKICGLITDISYIWTDQISLNENEALDEYIIVSTKVAYGADAYVKTCWSWRWKGDFAAAAATFTGLPYKL